MNLRLALAGLLAASPAAFAGDSVDVSGLYEVSTQGTSERLVPGQAGKVTVTIACKEGAHVDDQAPLKFTFTGKGATVEKSTVTYKDQVSKKAAGQKYANPV